jgi:hypothetical protein
LAGAGSAAAAVLAGVVPAADNGQRPATRPGNRSIDEYPRFFSLMPELRFFLPENQFFAENQPTKRKISYNTARLIWYGR